MDVTTGQIVAATLTDRAVDDAAQVGPLLDQVADPITTFMGDGAYDRNGVYAEMQARHLAATVVIPPRADAVLGDTTAPTQRDRHIQQIAKIGRLGWQRASQYNLRALVEAQIGRFKQVIGDALRFHTDAAQTTEITIAMQVPNRMLDLGRPKSVRVA